MRLSVRHKKYLSFLFCAVIFFGIFCLICNYIAKMVNSHGAVLEAYPFFPKKPIIFIGGFTTSGTRLLRTILDAHPEINCAVNEAVLPLGLPPGSQYCYATEHENQDLQRAHFLLVVQDGRAVAHTVLTQNATRPLDCHSYQECLIHWNFKMSLLYDKCSNLGPNACMLVYLEQLVLEPVESIPKLFAFLGRSMSLSVENYAEYLRNPDRERRSKLEFYSEGMQLPIFYLQPDQLTAWVGKMPKKVALNVNKTAPILTRLGYDSKMAKPDYRKIRSPIERNEE